jgi:hypothetical protein
MMQHNNAAKRYLSHVPATVVTDDAGASRAKIGPGSSHLGAKIDRYVTTQGALTLSEYNRQAAGFRPQQMDDRFRFLCDTAVKYRQGDAVVEDLYALEQQMSARLAGQGPGLSQDDIQRLRTAAL